MKCERVWVVFEGEWRGGGFVEREVSELDVRKGCVLLGERGRGRVCNSGRGWEMLCNNR